MISKARTQSSFIRNSRNDYLNEYGEWSSRIPWIDNRQCMQKEHDRSESIRLWHCRPLYIKQCVGLMYYHVTTGLSWVNLASSVWTATSETSTRYSNYTASSSTWRQRTRISSCCRISGRGRCSVWNNQIQLQSLPFGQCIGLLTV